jgi:hypothetical protein
MSDYCRACSEEIFGKDYGDMAGLVEEAQVAQGLAAAVLCEGCGPIQVDHQGRCLSGGCLKDGEEGHGLGVKRGADGKPAQEASP